MGMIAAGSILAVFLGNFLDEFLHTSPLFLIGLLLYVIVGSLLWLIKEVGGFRK
ncbi:MAG: AtpZ/AtpI family protein [Erysipelotrichaceae bacterium]